MKNQIILNIPHSSTKLTEEFLTKEKFLSDGEIRKLNLQMTDLFTDELFSYRRFIHLRAGYSRIACDVEKFTDDSMETMSKYGLGVVYSKNIYGERLLDCDAEYRERVLKKYYAPYHQALDEIVRKQLVGDRRVILVDCHSFSEEIILDDAKKSDLPDICIGMDEQLYHNRIILEYLCKYFTDSGYTVRVNYPYYGTMIPDYLLKEKADHFFSVMIEVNRNRYLTDYALNEGFDTLKRDILQCLKGLEELEIEDREKSGTC